MLAGEAADRLSGLDAETLAEARVALDDPGISAGRRGVAGDRLGASALHDPTEGGLLMGLHEMAAAAAVGLTDRPNAVLWFEPASAVCDGTRRRPVVDACLRDVARGIRLRRRPSEPCSRIRRRLVMRLP